MPSDASENTLEMSLRATEMSLRAIAGSRRAAMAWSVANFCTFNDDIALHHE
jgi:hypothetical protein